MKHIEMIIEYITGGTDYQYFDNRGVLIRCKDCKYCDKGIDEDGKPFLKCLGWVYGGTSETDFCSHAERRQHETD